MIKKTKKFSYLLTFLVAGVSLLAGMVFINPAKSVRQVAAAEGDVYRLAGTMNGWSTSNDDYILDYVSDTEYKYEGLLAKDVEFKIATNGSWDNPNYGYGDLDSSSKKYFSDSGGNIKIAHDNTGIVVKFNPENKTITAYLTVYELPNIVKASTEGVNLDRMRVWLDRGVFEVDGALNALQYGTKGTLTDESPIVEASGYIKLYQYEGDSSHWLAYFDIPIIDLAAGMDIRVARVNNVRSGIWNKTDPYEWQSGDNNKVLFVGNDWKSLSVGILSDDSQVLSTFAKHVLEGYLTCSPSTVNGYGAFPEMNRTFFVKEDGTFKISGLLDQVMITDYAPGDKNYTGSRVADATDAYSKYQKMEALYLASSGGSGAPSIFTNNSSITIVILISVIGITSLAALYFLRKKKVA